MKNFINVLIGAAYVVAILVLHEVTISRKFAFLLGCAHIWALGAFMIAECRKLYGKIWRSFALYMLFQALFFYFIPQTSWRIWVVTIGLFCAIGGYHTLLLYKEEVFIKSEQGNPEPAKTKYLIWGLTVLISIFGMLIS